MADIDSMPEPFRGELVERGHDIIYFGIATAALETRLRDQELRGTGHGTFFRSIGAALGYLPPQGSLVGKKNKRNYKFSQETRENIVLWLNQNVIVNAIGIESDFEQIETELIREFKPLMNIAKNPSPSAELRRLRAECVRIANMSE
jgi:hypothetical protein